MDNAKDQSKVAYGGMKEVRENRGIPKSDQFGKGNKMPQETKVLTKSEGKRMMHQMEEKDKKEDKEMMKNNEKTMHNGRHKEHR